MRIFKTPRGACGREIDNLLFDFIFMDRITRAKSERVRIVSRTHACVPIMDSRKSLVKLDCLVGGTELSGWIALVIKLCLGLLY